MRTLHLVDLENLCGTPFARDDDNAAGITVEVVLLEYSLSQRLNGVDHIHLLSSPLSTCAA